MDINNSINIRPQQVGGKYSSLSSSFGNLVPKDSVKLGGSRDDGLADLRKNIENMESLYSLMKKLGNSDKANQMKASIDKKKKMLEDMKNAPPPPEVTNELKGKIADFIIGKGAMPSELGADNREHLERFSSLVKNGMTFSDNAFHDLKPEDAFGKLIGSKYQGFGNQVTYKTFEGGMIAMSTLRTEYLKSLDHFIKYSKKGFVFYETTEKGYQPIKTAGEFIKKFRDNPEDAVVEAMDGSFVSPEKAERIKTEEEIRRLVPDDPRERPEIVEKEDTVIIGGVVLKKRK